MHGIRWAWLVLAGCSGGAADSTSTQPTTGPTTGTEDSGYPSSFTAGAVRMTRFAIRPLDDGADVDGDGTPDNNLPQVLATADSLTDEDLSLAAVNAAIALGLSTGTSAVVLDARHADRDLTVALLGGTWNPATDALTIDPGWYVGGEPRAQLTGQFQDEVAFQVGADAIDVPVVVVDTEPAVLYPIAQAVLKGELDATASRGELTGVIPVDLLLDQVFGELIPPEGLDVDANGTIGADETHAALIDQVRDLLTDPALADVLLDDGSRGVSVAFDYEAVAAAL